MMSADASPKILVLSLILLGVSFLLIGAVAVAVLLPVLPCPYHSSTQDTEEPDPCMGCNGYGRSTLFQHWNRVRYEQQREPYLIKL